MGPHFDSYANSGIPDIKGTEHQLYSGEGNEKRLELLHLLPHLHPSDVGINMTSRIDDLQLLAKAIIDSTGRRPASHPNHSTTYRLTHLSANLLQQERRLLGTTAENIIHILCNTELSDTLTDRGCITSATDYLGFLTEKPGFTGVDKWGDLRRMESGWGDWFGVIGQVCKSWHAVTQKRRSNPSHITFLARHSKAEHWPTYGGRVFREIQPSYKPYKKLHSVYVGNRVIQNKTQAHDLVNILYDRVPTLKKSHLPNTTTEIGLRATKTLAMRGLGLRDSIQLVTWLHGLPTTGAKDFLTLMRDSPRATVIHVLEGCEQIALLNLVTLGYLPEKPLQERGGHLVGEQLLPYTLVFYQELFPRLTYMQNLITHIRDPTTHIPGTTKNIITYDPLDDDGDDYIPRPRPFSTHPHLSTHREKRDPRQLTSARKPTPVRRLGIRRPPGAIWI